MAETSKDSFDPDATVRQSAVEPDPDATVSLPAAEPDPETTVRMPAAEPDAESTVRGPLFDPEATASPASTVEADPEATVRIPSPGRQRRNPFAPSALPASLQANLSALGGLNLLIAIANPILGAVPQIRHALRHSDPKRLRATLRDQIEAFEATAQSAEVPEKTLNTAIDALCALLDESAAATPWGADWKGNGLRHELRRESAGEDGFSRLLDRVTADANADAELLEFLYVCLALGFEGHRELDQFREKLHAAASRRRPRPVDGLSERWRGVNTPAAPQVADKAPRPVPAPAPAQVSHYSAPRARLSRNVVSRIALGVLATLVVGFVLVLRLVEDDGKPEAAKPRVRQPAQPIATSSTPPPLSASASLSKELENEAVAITESAGRITFTLRDESQFASGGVAIKPELNPLLRRVAQALDRVPGAITVTAYTDAVPMRPGRFASNQELSLARAESVAKAMAAALSEPRRLKAEGRADSEPLAPSDTPGNRAKNRRMTIVVTPGS